MVTAKILPPETPPNVLARPTLEDRLTEATDLIRAVEAAAGPDADDAARADALGGMLCEALDRELRAALASRDVSMMPLLALTTLVAIFFTLAFVSVPAAPADEAPGPPPSAQRCPA